MENQITSQAIWIKPKAHALFAADAAIAGMLPSQLFDAGVLPETVDCSCYQFCFQELPSPTNEVKLYHDYDDSVIPEQAGSGL